MLETLLLDDLLVEIDVNLSTSGLAKLQRAVQRDGTPTGSRRWIIQDRATLNAMMAESIIAADGTDEFKAICAEAANDPDPFWAFRNYMSVEALEAFNLRLKAHNAMSQFEKISQTEPSPA